jgi:cellulose 1,4-beta-cellobiosidase
MLWPLRSVRALLGSSLAIAMVVVVAIAGPAFAEWTSGPVQGSQTVSTGTLVAPTGLTAVNGACVNNTSWHVNLSWTATTSTIADGYEIFRSTTTGGPYTSLGTVNGRTTTTFVDTTPTFLTTYFYVVQAKRNLWRSPNSTQATVTTLKKNCT